VTFPIGLRATVDADFARQLERELSKAHDGLRNLRASRYEVEKALKKAEAELAAALVNAEKARRYWRAELVRIRRESKALREALEKIAAHRDGGKSGLCQRIAREALNFKGDPPCIKKDV
jgi:predicted  nucleic acid-binding Zn-ribbon protein